ncbi:MAG: hypothetical protein IKF82_04680 [Bacilli bacterium]|nr:hypothetical protein [Bacilli bacterium]
MEKTINIIIAVIFLALCSICGYTVYSNSKYRAEVKKLNDKINVLVSPTLVECPKEKSVVGYYKAGKLSDPKKTCEQGLEETREIQLLSDGTFKYKYLSSCESTTQSGIYSKNDTSVTLACDTNTSEQCVGSGVKYTFGLGNTLVFTGDNGEVLTFAKVSENDLQALN